MIRLAGKSEMHTYRSAMVMIVYGDIGLNPYRPIQPLFEAQVRGSDAGSKLVTVSLKAGHFLLPSYKAKQPFGLIPCLEDADLTVFESRAIARYLAEKYEGQGTPLLGKTLKERAIINQWADSEAQNFQPATGPMVREAFVAAFGIRPVDEEVVAAGMKKLDQVLDVCEAHLAKGTKYLAGDDFSLADLFHTVYMNWMKSARPELLEKRPHLSAWIHDITTRPAFLRCLQLDWENASPIQ
uniref:glutathione transferase n=2 Tax=Physcomitrium patens TaxID=3218 RepID=K9Y578_PHYPA|nr:phi class glutathione S-transferase [Physcomitrium patens]